MRMFRCNYIEGQYWLAADMRLQCYDREWAGYVTRRVSISTAVLIINLILIQFCS